MPHAVFVSAVIHAPIEQVWPLLRDFDGLASWHPAIAKSTIEEGGRVDALGSVRYLAIRPKGFVRERLLMLDDGEHALRYSILETDLPMRNYVAGVALRPVTMGELTYGEWWADFDVDPGVDKHQVAEGIRAGVFAAGFEALNAKLRR